MLEPVEASWDGARGEEEYEEQQLEEEEEEAASSDGEEVESDLLLGILDSLDPDMFLHYGSPEQVEEEEECAGDTGPLPTSAGFPLGPSLPKLEAINELIRFDHEYTKPFLLQVPPEGASPPGMPGAVEGEILFRAETALLRGPPVSVKEEPTDVLLPELGMSHLLSSDPQQQQQSPMDGSSDSGYEGSPSPFSDLASPLGTDYVWDEAFANELFPQLISV
ncbi:PREDICTED: X-box-binding protein 1 [Gekko japonicus]|uniref:X-box-binding protein 1 n=1 Tax=Gekko japonicus TaxID=146911 RepID=A0ABM1L9X4_GEKJA|nr:PREDICTED: X-box-binding protein 1 [Gekko japonicus]